MKRFALVAVMALVAVLMVSQAAIVSQVGDDPTFIQGFETDTSGWLEDFGGTVTRQPSGYTNGGGYADGVASAAGGFHARLGRTGCDTITGGIGNAVLCNGPVTRWGGYNSVWQGGYTTQVDVYFDVPYAVANPDTTSGNLTCLTATPTDPACKGTWFSFSSAINDSAGNFRRGLLVRSRSNRPIAADPRAGLRVGVAGRWSRVSTRCGPA